MNEENNGKMPICPWCHSRRYVEEIPYEPWMLNMDYFQCEHNGEKYPGSPKYFKVKSKRPIPMKVLQI